MVGTIQPNSNNPWYASSIGGLKSRIASRAVRALERAVNVVIIAHKAEKAKIEC